MYKGAVAENVFIVNVTFRESMRLLLFKLFHLAPVNFLLVVLPGLEDETVFANRSTKMEKYLII